MHSAQQMGQVVNGKVAPYDFTIRDMLKEGWEKTAGFKAVLWQGIAIYFVISLLLFVLNFLLIGMAKAVLGNTSSSMEILNGVLKLVRELLEFPLIVGLLMMGVKRAVNLPVQPTLVLKYYPQFIAIFAMVLLEGFLVFLPLGIGGTLIASVFSGAFSFGTSAMMSILGGLLCSVGIYLAWGYSFALQILAEKKLGIWRSLEVSRRGVTQHWFKILFTSLMIFLIIFISCLPLLIGLIWSLPWAYSTSGVLYRTIFGVEEARSI